MSNVLPLSQSLFFPCGNSSPFSPAAIPPSCGKNLFCAALSFVPFLWFPNALGLVLQPESRRPTNGDLGSKQPRQGSPQVKLN
jgi:hypothetical protein